MTQHSKPDDRSTCRLDARHLRCAAIVFLLCILVYNWNGDFSYNPDVLPHAQLARSVYRDGDVVTSASETPGSFVWLLKDGDREVPVTIEALDDEILSLWDDGTLRVDRNDYFYSPSIREGEYVSPWGPGVAIVSAPFFWAWETLVRDINKHPGDLWLLGKFVATLFVAASAAVVYLTGAVFVPRGQAALVAVTYAFATSVWSISSQNLWQHSAMELFLALGALSLCRLEGATSGVAAGLSFAISTWCRPTGVLFVLPVAAYYAWTNRRGLIAFCLTGLPFAIVLMWYNARHFGSPFIFGQNPVDHPEVIAVSGKGDLWQTPLTYGLMAHLVSPSRGLFIYSPVLLFSVWGAVRAWRDRRFLPLRALSIAVCLLIGLQAKFFDWWGGFSFGYRHIVDITPTMALFLLPVIGWIVSTWTLRVLFAICLAWSIFVQILGVCLYDVVGWNARTGLVVHPSRESPQVVEPGLDRYPRWILDPRAKAEPTLLNIDDPMFRYRLWQWSDSQLAYYVMHPARARHVRNVWTALATRDRARLLADTHRGLGNAYLALGRREKANDQFSLALTHNSHDVEASVGQFLARASGSREGLHDLLDRVDETSTVAVHNRLAVLLAPQHPEEAFLQLDRAAELEPLESLFEPPDMSLTPPWLAVASKEADEETIRRFRLVFEAAVLLNCGWYERQHGRPEQAARIFKQLADLAPEQAIAQLRWGQALQAAGQWSESIVPISRSLESGLYGRWRSEALRALNRGHDGKR